MVFYRRFLWSSKVTHIFRGSQRGSLQPRNFTSFSFLPLYDIGPEGEAPWRPYDRTDEPAQGAAPEQATERLRLHLEVAASDDGPVLSSGFNLAALQVLHGGVGVRSDDFLLTLLRAQSSLLPQSDDEFAVTTARHAEHQGAAALV